MEKEEIDSLLLAISSTELPQQLKGIEKVTKIVAVMAGYGSEMKDIGPQQDTLDFIEKIIEEYDILGRMVDFVIKSYNVELMNMCLVNLNTIIWANPNHSKILIEYHLIEASTQLLKTTSDSLVEMGLLILGNLALHDAHARARIIKAGAITDILNLLPQVKERVLSLVLISWAIHNICCPNPLPSYDEVLVHVISSVCGLVKELSTVKRGIHTDEIHELLYMILIHISSYGSDEVIDHLSEDLIKALVFLFLKMLNSPKLVELILRLFGVIFTRNPGQIKIAMENRMVKCLSGMFVKFKDNEQYQNVIKESCLLIAHIIALAADGSQDVYDEKLIGLVVDFAKSGTSSAEEPVWAISMAAAYGSGDEVRAWLTKDAIEVMCMNLKVCQDDDLLLINLDGLSRVLRFREDYAKWVDWRNIRLVKKTRTKEMSDIASRLIMKFWHADYGGEIDGTDGGGAVEEASIRGQSTLEGDFANDGDDRCGELGAEEASTSGRY